jgi:nitrogen fixation protein NifU and related proteins
MERSRELNEAVILDHNRNPRNCHRPQETNRQGNGTNPFCGDRVNVYLQVKDEYVEDIGFQASGCAICMASASLMTETLKGKSLTEVRPIVAKFRAFFLSLTHEKEETSLPGQLAVLAGVRAFPLRIKCATLAWDALSAALIEANVAE